MSVKYVCAVLAAFFLAGCMSQPMTRNTIADVGGIDEINKFQYYVSTEIKLTATERIREPNFNRQGSASVKEFAYRDVIVIGKNTKGVLVDSKITEDGLLVLEICFEEKANDSDKRLIFKQEGPGLEHKFYIVYTDPKKRSLQYGDREYSFESKVTERLYLKIYVDKSKIEKERIRRVKGRRVEF